VCGKCGCKETWFTGMTLDEINQMGMAAFVALGSILRVPVGSPLEAVTRHADSAEPALAALFTLAGSESVREVRVQGHVVYRNDVRQD
jgi:hypothetical protein